MMDLWNRSCVSSYATTFKESKTATNEHAEQATRPAVYAEAAGETLRARTFGQFTVSEKMYPAGLALANHAHREAHITFVVEGIFREQYSRGEMTCRTGTVRFLPAGEVHANEIEGGMRCLNISASAEFLDQLRGKPLVPSNPSQINGLTASWLANRLYGELAREDQASAIAIEGLVLAILAEIARADALPNRSSAPSWLKQATDIVEARFLERLSLAEIASEVGVHYVHLSRQFHKYNRCTIGEMLRRRRVQYASHLLAHSDTPLAEIALICGFSDQSHLSFLFKRYVGISPSKYRSLAGRQDGTLSLQAIRGHSPE